MEGNLSTTEHLYSRVCSEFYDQQKKHKGIAELVQCIYICQNVYRRFAVLRILLALVLPTIEKKLGENSFS